MISTFNVFHTAARVTITGCLAATFFKQAVVDTTRQTLYDAEDRLSVGSAVSRFCLSTACLVLASHRTAKKLLSGDFSPKDDPPLLAGNIYTPAPSRIQRCKRLSLESDMTIVADDDDYLKEFDTPDLPLFATDSFTTVFTVPLSINTNPAQSIILPCKPPDTVCIAHRCKQQHSAHLRAAPARADIGHLQQFHDEIIADKAALIDAGPTPWPSSASHLHWRPQTRTAQATPHYYPRPEDTHLPPSLSHTTWSNPRG